MFGAITPQSWSKCFLILFYLKIGWKPHNKAVLWRKNKSKYRHSFLDSTTTLSTSVFSVFLCQIQGQYFRILYVEYGNTGCQVSNLGIQKTIDFCLNLKFSKGFLDTYLLKLKLTTKMWVLLYEVHFLKLESYEKFQLGKL